MGYNDTFICKVSQDSQNESNIPKKCHIVLFLSVRLSNPWQRIACTTYAMMFRIKASPSFSWAFAFENKSGSSIWVPIEYFSRSSLRSSKQSNNMLLKAAVKYHCVDLLGLF